MNRRFAALISDSVYKNFLLSWRQSLRSDLGQYVSYSLVPRPHPRGESLMTFGWIPWALLTLITFWGEFSICQSHCRKRHLWLQHWKLLATSAQWPQFEKNELGLSLQSQLTASYEFLIKLEVSAKCHLVGGVLAWDNLMNLVFDHTARSMKHADIISALLQ